MNYKIILASGSPRRQQLMRALRIPFSVRTTFVSEDYPTDLAAEDVAEFLAGKKGKAYQGALADDELVITADTTVVLEERILNKPADATEAQAMLRSLSGRSHRVITGVGLTTAASVQTFADATTVHFRVLTDEEIDFYVENYQPYDKAGGYAIQEWIGMVAIEGIVGSYFNVVGLPVEKLYQELRRFGKIQPTPF
ncbi:MAG: Maf family nucleotide pyrophosphatase [Tunicatimonas sp.]